MLKNLLSFMLEQLKVCQKALSGYLDQKRYAFPRFYFVSDVVLLEVLSQGSNPEAIQPHLSSGIKNKGAAFIFTDKEIKEEGFLEYIYIFLNTGELPNLFSRDELDGIYGEVSVEYAKSPLAKPGEDPLQDDLFAYFISRVRANLHIVLCFSPVGPKLLQRTLKFAAEFRTCEFTFQLPDDNDPLVRLIPFHVQLYAMPLTDSDHL